MGQLIALVFDDPYKADEARAALFRLAGEGHLELEETAVISKPPTGRTRVSQDLDIVKRDKSVGHVAGLLTAAITGTFPFILGGTIAGRLLGAFTDHGVTNAFIEDIKKQVQAGTSCLIVFGASDPQRRTTIFDRLRAFHPQVLESDLPDEIEQSLSQTLRDQ